MKTGGHIKPCKVGSVEEHNERNPEYVERMKQSKHPLNFYPELALRSNYNSYNQERNEYRDKVTGKPLKVAQIFNKMIEVYTKHDKRHRRPPLKERERFDPKTGKMKTIAGWSPIREMVVVTKPDTKPEDFDKVKAWFRDNHVGTMFLSLHFDEGHLDDAGNLKANNHAHMGLDFFDWETGKTVKLGPAKMKELQTVLADALGMERGEIKEVTGAEHMDVPEYREVAEAVKEKRQEEQEIDSRLDEKRQEFDHLSSEVSSLKVKKTIGGAAVAVGQTVAGWFGQSDKDKTIEQLQDIIDHEPERTAAAVTEWKEKYEIQCDLNHRKNNQIKELQTTTRQQSDTISRLNAKVSALDKENVSLKSKLTVMDKIEKAMTDCCNWAAKCAKGSAVWAWVYEKFEALCDAKGINEEWKNGRHSVAADVWLGVVDPDNGGRAYGQFTEKQQQALNDELHKAADHPELGRGRGVTR